MPLNDEEKLELARARRARTIEIMQACTCAWPITTYRNISGHKSECPSHEMILGDRKEREKKLAELGVRR